MAHGGRDDVFRFNGTDASFRYKCQTQSQGAEPLKRQELLATTTRTTGVKMMFSYLLDQIKFLQKSRLRRQQGTAYHRKALSC